MRNIPIYQNLQTFNSSCSSLSSKKTKKQILPSLLTSSSLSSIKPINKHKLKRDLSFSKKKTNYDSSSSTLDLDFIQIKHENDTLKSIISKLKEELTQCQSQIKIYQNKVVNKTTSNNINDTQINILQQKLSSIRKEFNEQSKEFHLLK